MVNAKLAEAIINDNVIVTKLAICTLVERSLNQANELPLPDNVKRFLEHFQKEVASTTAEWLRFLH